MFRGVQTLEIVYFFAQCVLFLKLSEIVPKICITAPYPLLFFKELPLKSIFLAMPLDAMSRNFKKINYLNDYNLF